MKTNTPRSTIKLTDEEKRAKIAEACGWQAHHHKGGTDWSLLKPCGYVNGVWQEGIPAGHWQLCGVGPIPDYQNDLNAMHKAEKGLSNMRSAEYENLLVKIAADGLDTIQCFAAGYSFHATASQRAEAFGLTLQLWEAGQ